MQKKSLEKLSNGKFIKADLFNLVGGGHQINTGYCNVNMPSYTNPDGTPGMGGSGMEADCCY